jgi:hypothetical protein
MVRPGSAKARPAGIVDAGMIGQQTMRRLDRGRQPDGKNGPGSRGLRRARCAGYSKAGDVLLLPRQATALRNQGESMFSKGETVRSLRAYFYLVGVVGVALYLYQLLSQPPSLFSVFSCFGVAAGLSYIYLGARLPSLLLEAPRRPQLIVLASGVLLAVNLVVCISLEISDGMSRSFWGLLIVGYLVGNLRRLAREARVELPAAQA